MRSSSVLGMSLLVLCTTSCLVGFEPEEYVTAGIGTTATSGAGSSASSGGASTSTGGGAGGAGGSADNSPPCDGECPSTEISAEKNGIVGLATDGTRVYWAAADRHVRKALPDGTERQDLWDSAQQAEQPSGIAIDGDVAYWTTRSNTQPTATGAIWQGAAGDGMEAATNILPNQSGLNRIAVDADFIYFSERHADNTTSIQRLSKAGGAPEELLGGISEIWDLEVDGDFLIATENREGRLWRIPIDPDPAAATILHEQTIIEDPSYPWDALGLAVTTGGIYWCNRAMQRIMFLGREPDAVVEEFALTGDCGDVAGNDQWIYWLNQGDGGIGSVLAQRAGQPNGGAYFLEVGIENIPERLAFDDGHVYYGTYVGPSKVVRLDLNP